MPIRNKNSSLLWTFVDYRHKKFYKIGSWEGASLDYYPIKIFNKLIFITLTPGPNVIKLLLSVIYEFL